VDGRKLRFVSQWSESLRVQIWLDVEYAFGALTGFDVEEVAVEWCDLPESH
jgi:hypothetical protein